MDTQNTQGQNQQPTEVNTVSQMPQHHTPHQEAKQPKATEIPQPHHANAMPQPQENSSHEKAPIQNPQTIDKMLRMFLYDKMPHLPQKWKEFLVAYIPILTLVSLFFRIPSILALFGASWYLSYFSRFSYAMMIDSLFMLGNTVVTLIALPGLFGRKKSAWRLLLVVIALNALADLFTFNIIRLLIGAAVSLYFYYQLEEYYT